MFFEQNERLAKEIGQLNKIDRQDLFIKLLDSGALNFVELASLYADILQSRNKKQEHDISNLGLMLASYCITDSSPSGKNARKHLYKSGAFGKNDGSVFGKQLDEEFGNNQEATVTPIL